MNHLSSCYFCGSALDDTLREYPVVPAEFREDDADATTATLCPTCHEKLRAVLEAVVDAADPEDGTTTHSAAGDAEPTGDSEAEDEAGSVEVITDDAAEDAVDSAEADTGDAAIAGDSLFGDGDADDGDDALFDENDAAGDDVRDAMEADVPDEFQPDDSTDDVNSTPSDADDQLSSDADDPLAAIAASDADESGDDAPVRDDPSPAGDVTEGEAVEETGKEPDDEMGDKADDETATGTGEETTTGADGQTATGDKGTASARTTISALEYNKVMRLLQNREFPVDREEIETVAANAYDLSRAECAEVLDLAVDRGLVDESGGQLVRPE